MSSFLLIIETDNVAFHDPHELSEILLKLSVKLDDTDIEDVGNGFVRDSNGNRVGAWHFDPNGMVTYESA